MQLTEALQKFNDFKLFAVFMVYAENDCVQGETVIALKVV